MPRLTARGVAFLVAAVALTVLAYLLERPELLPVAAIAAGAPLIALALVASSRPQLRIGRQLEPAIAVEGEPVRVAVTLNGRARAAEWVERVPMAPGYAGPGRLPEVIATRAATVRYRYWPARRGMPFVGPLLIEDRDPFALALRVTDTRVQVAQLVLPMVTPLPAGPVPDPSTEQGQRTARSRERADDDVVTREYRDGDALRRVHWRVTARQGELMVRQDEPQAGPHARVVLDTQFTGYGDAMPARRGRAATSPAFEWAVRMAASAAVHLAERGYTVDLATPTPRAAQAPVADGPVGDVLGELALIELGDRVIDLDARSASGAPPVVVIAAAPDDATLSWMLAQRSPRAPAVALLVGPPAPLPVRPGAAPAELDADPVRTAFERSGWRVARVSVRATPDAAWSALLGDTAGLGPDAARELLVPRG